jgi:hypothetical protein
MNFPPLDPLRQPPLTTPEREDLSRVMTAGLFDCASKGLNAADGGKYLATMAASWFAGRNLPDFEERERNRVLRLIRRAARDVITFMRAAGAWPWQAHQALAELDDLLNQRKPMGTHTAAGRRFPQAGYLVPKGTVVIEGAKEPIPMMTFEELTREEEGAPKLGEPANPGPVGPGFHKEDFSS